MNTCKNCSKQFDSNFQFCPYCGKNLKSNLSAYAVTGTICLLLLTGYFAKDKLMGQPPKVSLDTTTSGKSNNINLDPQTIDAISSLRDKAVKEPENIEVKKQLTKKMWEALQEIKDPAIITNEPALQQMGLELVDILSELTRINPNDSESTLLMADVSFTMRLFSKSSEYYGKYLKLNPDDYVSRAHYASSLTFLKKYDESIKELDTVLKIKPDFFQALAYKTITYAEKGDKENAIKTGKLAVKFAPNDDARDRINSFVVSLDGKPDSAENLTEEETVRKFFINHQIIGPKLVNTALEGKVFKLILKDFPMSAMPPVAKEALFGKVKGLSSSWKTIEKVVFFDSASGSVMEEVQLSK